MSCSAFHSLPRKLPLCTLLPVLYFSFLSPVQPDHGKTSSTPSEIFHWSCSLPCFGKIALDQWDEPPICTILFLGTFRCMKFPGGWRNACSCCGNLVLVCWWPMWAQSFADSVWEFSFQNSCKSSDVQCQQWKSAYKTLGYLSSIMIASSSLTFNIECVQMRSANLSKIQKGFLACFVCLFFCF